jgi:hypothetical protein
VIGSSVALDRKSRVGSIKDDLAVVVVARTFLPSPF